MKRIVNIPDRTYNFIMGLNQHTFGSKYAHKDVQADVVKAVKESKPYDDSGNLISREDLIKAIEPYKGKAVSTPFILDIINKAQAVEYTFEETFQKTVCENRLYCPARSKGEWINQFIGGNECVMCSECKLHFDIGTNFCPNCGADMRKGGKT